MFILSEKSMTVNASLLLSEELEDKSNELVDFIENLIEKYQTYKLPSKTKVQ
mgnify:CR=1 FL=1